MSTPADVLRVARSQDGYAERGSNQTKYWAELDKGLQGNPWCAAYVSWVFLKAGCPLPAMGKSYGYVYVPAAIAYAKAHELWDTSGHYAPGDIVCFGHGAHTGIIAADDGKTMTVWEGNTSPDGSAGSQVNGGQVALRHRPHSDWVDGVLKTSRWLVPVPTKEIDVALTEAEIDKIAHRVWSYDQANTKRQAWAYMQAAAAPLDVSALSVSLAKLIPAGVALSQGQIEAASKAAIKSVLGSLDAP